VKTAATIRRGEDPVATYVIMGICVALGLGSMLSDGNWISGGLSKIDVDFGLFGPYVANGEVYRLVTSGFLHAGPFHLLVNMYSLYILGSLLEPSIGRTRFLLIYFAGLFAGSFGALLENPLDLTRGASTAIFGLMGAAVVVMRNRGIDPMQSGLPLWIGINLVFSFAVPGISVGGHIGGLIGGAAATLALSRFGRGHAAYGRAGLLGTAGIVTVGIVSIAVAYWKVKGYA
jgi:membrane associated rhomboid family serine protease